MRPLNPKEQAEVDFWRQLKSHHGDKFMQFRASEYEAKTKNFPTFEKVTQGVGIKGLDLGSGCVSVFDGWGLDVVALDPLMEKYAEIEPGIFKQKVDVEYVQQGYPDEIPFPPNWFDWVFCVNVIDHTEDSHKMVEEIFRVLKSGGTLFFEVNFDDQLAPPHYLLWDEKMVNAHFSKYTLLDSVVERLDSEHQTRFWGTYVK